MIDQMPDPAQGSQCHAVCALLLPLNSFEKMATATRLFELSQRPYRQKLSPQGPASEPQALANHRFLRPFPGSPALHSWFSRPRADVERWLASPQYPAVVIEPHLFAGFKTRVTKPHKAQFLITKGRAP